MRAILHIVCPFAGPFDDEMHAVIQPLAESISQEPDLLW